VILTDAVGTTGELVRASLEAHGLRVATLAAPSAHRDAPGFLRELKKLVTHTGARTIIPIFFPEVIAAHRNEFNDVAILAEDPEKILLLDDKKKACDLAESLGINQPKRYSNPDEITTYPVVFKRTTGQGGDSVYFPKDRQAISNLIKTAKSYLITDYVEGENYCIDVLRFKGYLLSSAYKVLEPIGKGVSTKRQSITDPYLESAAFKMLDDIDYNGVCGFDFRRDSRTGEFLFLECNPRFSGGLQTTIDSGLDLPYLYYSLYHENQDK